MKNLKQFFSKYSTKELVERTTPKAWHRSFNMLVLHSPLYLEKLIFVVSYKLKAASVSVLELLPMKYGPLPSIRNSGFFSQGNSLAIYKNTGKEKLQLKKI